MITPASGEDADSGLDGLGGENAVAAGHGPGSWRIVTTARRWPSDTLLLVPSGCLMGAGGDDRSRAGSGGAAGTTA